MAHDARVSVPAGVAPAGTADAHRRPRAVTFIAGLSILEGVLAVGLAGLIGTSWWVDAPAIQQGDLTTYLYSGVLLTVSGFALLLSAGGLLYLRAWAWTLAMSTQCLTLTVALYEYLSNDPDYLLMALGVLAVLLLNRQEVRLAFERTEHHHGEHPGAHTESANRAGGRGPGRMQVPG